MSASTSGVSVSVTGVILSGHFDLCVPPCSKDLDNMLRENAFLDLDFCCHDVKAQILRVTQLQKSTQTQTLA